MGSQTGSRDLQPFFFSFFIPKTINATIAHAITQRIIKLKTGKIVIVYMLPSKELIIGLLVGSKNFVLTVELKL